LKDSPPAPNNDAAAFQIDMGTETIADAESSSEASTASSPTGTSVVMNILAAARRERPEGIGAVRRREVRLEQRQHPE